MRAVPLIDPFASDGNSSFSSKVPGLQLAVDSTSLGAFKTCPRYYEYSILRGRVARGESPHLAFGLALHQAREHYERFRLKGESHDEALGLVVDEAIAATWDSILKRPSAWTFEHKLKTRNSLLRTIVWYLDKLGDNDPVKTIQLANGQPAVELSFSFAFGASTRLGEPWLLCGHIDRLGELNSTVYPVDIKTTTHMLNKEWFAGFSPDNQFSLYSVACRVVFGQQTGDLIVDGVQIGAQFSRFDRALIPRSAEFLDDWLRDTGSWLKQMEQAAVDQHWPMNEKSCDKYGGCPYREVCSASPSAREARIEKFTKRTWDPLQIRGDI